MAREFVIANSDFMDFGNPPGFAPSLAMTVAMIWRYNTHGVPTTKIISRASASGLGGWSVGISGAIGAEQPMFTKYGVADIVASTLGIPTGSRYFNAFAVSPTGVRFARANLSTIGTLDFETVANAGGFGAKAADTFFVGCEQINSLPKQRFFGGELEVAAVWMSTASDDQVTDLRYGGLAAWYGISNLAVLWQWDQSDVAQEVVDEAQTCHQQARSGTNVAVNSYPEWGGVGPSHTPL
jgi:hypothetical protein